RPFLGAPSRLSSDRTGGSVISTLEEKDSYDVGGAKSDGHGGAESSCQKQHPLFIDLRVLWKDPFRTRSCPTLSRAGGISDTFRESVVSTAYRARSVVTATSAS